MNNLTNPQVTNLRNLLCECLLTLCPVELRAQKHSEKIFHFGIYRNFDRCSR